MFDKKKLLCLKVAFCVLGALTVTNAKESIAETPVTERSDVCGGSDIMHFKFSQFNNTEFSIPEPYLDRRMILPQSRPYNQVIFRFKLGNLDAKCDKNAVEENNAFSSSIPVTLQPYNDLFEKNFSELFLSRTYLYNKPVQGQDNFSSFRSQRDITTDPQKYVSELLVPKNESLKNKYFLVCHGASTHFDKCIVTQHIRDGIYADYIIDESQLIHLDKIVPKMDEKIIGFIK